MSNQDIQSARAVTVFSTISHPILKSVDQVAVSKFIRDRERCEKQVKEKRSEIMSLTEASYCVSVDVGLLRTLIFLGTFDTSSPDEEADELTLENTKVFIHWHGKTQQVSIPR